MHLSRMQINQTAPAVTPRVLPCIQAAKAEGSGKMQQHIVLPSQRAEQSTQESMRRACSKRGS